MYARAQLLSLALSVDVPRRKFYARLAIMRARETEADLAADCADHVEIPSLSGSRSRSRDAIMLQPRSFSHMPIGFLPPCQSGRVRAPPHVAEVFDGGQAGVHMYCNSVG
jgi:hypothetical protein